MKSITRSQLTTLPEYFGRYIQLCDDVDIITAIHTSIRELYRDTIQKLKELGDRVYAPGKWTVKDILQHIIDTERIFAYRALCIARNEKQTFLSFDENSYAEQSQASKRPLESLVEELILTHHSTKALFESLSPEMLGRKGMGFAGEYSVQDVGFILPGHQRWHLKVLEERYYPLL